MTTREDEIREQFDARPSRPLPQLIGLSGYAQSGKDTVGQILVNRRGYTRAAFADKLKDLARQTDLNLNFDVERYGWEVIKTEPSVRQLLQNLGVACRNVIGPDVWVDALFHDLDPFRPTVITDVRFPNEATRIRKAGGEVWRVTRPGTGPVNDHPSESALDGMTFDRYVVNNGTLEELEQEVLR